MTRSKLLIRPSSKTGGVPVNALGAQVRFEMVGQHLVRMTVKDWVGFAPSLEETRRIARRFGWRESGEPDEGSVKNDG